LYSYGIRPTRSINELRRVCGVVRNELAAIRAPVLVVHGQRDRVIDPRCAREIGTRLVGSEAVEVDLLPRSGHAISVDIDRDTVNTDVLNWFQRFATSARPAAVVAGR
jgi:esterase/lipase